MPIEERFKVWHAPMVDVRIRTIQVPEIRIGGEIPGHIFMHVPLQIDTKRRTIGTDYDVGADADIRRDVPHGVGNPPVRAIIGYPMSRPLDRRLHQLCSGFPFRLTVTRVRSRAYSKRRKQKNGGRNYGPPAKARHAHTSNIR
jgi:hypothetical protein